jgi:hypothetical protein
MSTLRKYGVATTILFPLIDRGAQDFESTPVTFAAGDVKISKDEGAFANIGTLPTHEGNGMYSVPLTATEAQAARIMITVIDQTATKEWEDQAEIIETYGNASGQHAFDLDAAEQDVNLVNWLGSAPNALISGRVETEIGRFGDLEIRRNTARGGAIDRIVLDAGASTTTDEYNGHIILLVSGTGAGQARLIHDYIIGTVALTSPDWITAPDATTGFVILGLGMAAVESWRNKRPSATLLGRVDVTVGAMQSDVLTIAATAAAWFQEAADRLLDRPISNVEPGAAFRTLYGLAASAVNKREIISGPTIRLYKSNDTDVLVDIPITEDATQDPISALDPP